MKKTNIIFCSFPDFSSHAKALYLYMKKQNLNNLKMIWVVYNQKIKQKLKEKGIEAIVIGTKEFFKKMEIADIIFSTHGNLIDYKNDKTIYVDLWHGVGVKPAGYLINNISEFDLNWLQKFRKKVDYMIVPSAFWQLIFSSIFHIKIDRILPIAYPKFDLQNNKNAKHNLEKILNINVRKYNKIVYYMPTIKQKNNVKEEKKIDLNKIFNLENEEYNDLNKFLIDNNILLCIKRHPSEENIYNNFESNNIKIITNNMLEEQKLDVDEILNAADIMISDYSSIAIEFKFLKKKTIFINNNIKEFEKNRGIFLNNYSYWTDNIEVSNMSELKEELLKDANNINEEKYKIWFGSLKNGGCKKIYDYFFENEKIRNNINNTWCKEKILEKKLEEVEKNIENLKNKINITTTLKDDYKNKYENTYNELEQSKAELCKVTKKLEQVKLEYNKIEKELKKLKHSKFYKIYSKMQKIYLLIRGDRK